MGNKKHKLVGAPGFEPGASCAQGRRATKNNASVFNVPAETKQLSRDRSMWLAVRKCAHLSFGWAQKLAQLRWRASCPQFWSDRFPCVVRLLNQLQIPPSRSLPSCRTTAQNNAETLLRAIFYGLKEDRFLRKAFGRITVSIRSKN